MSQSDNYDLLINKLDQFTRKYYVNKMIRGALYFIALVVLLFLGMSFLEHEFYFSTTVRKILFYSFIGISVISLYGWVLRPILQYFKLGKVISHHQAASIIGNHFSDVKDKLLNVLQLKTQSSIADQKDLIEASIDQKSKEIEPVPFKSAIDLKENRKYLRYALPPLLLLLIILFTAPSVIKDGTSRLLRNSVAFEKPAPFSFVIDKDNLQVVQFEDFLLEVKIEGELLPNEVFIEIDNYQYRLNKEAADKFTYQFNNVQEDTEFKLYSSGVNSVPYDLDVLEKPNLLDFEVVLDYPAYTGRKDETLKSIGDLVIPIGTKLDWIFNAERTDEIAMKFSSADTIIITDRFDEGLFTYEKRALQDEAYKVYISNAILPNADSVLYSITTIQDLYPNISVEKFDDSTDNKLVYFVGDASDDYGLLNLSFNYTVNREGGKAVEETFKLAKPSGNQIRFNHVFDLNSLELKPGDEVTYFFEVFDNDEVNGSKSARSNIMVFSVPTVEELKAQEEQNDEQIKDELQKALEESQKIQQEIKKMKEKLLQEKDLDWQSRKELEKLLDRQKDLEKKIEDAKEKFEENLKNQEQYSEMDEEIMEKQEKLQEMFDEVMSEEMKELMEQIEELLQELEKDVAFEMIEEMEFSDEEMEKELDRMLELYKQLELEKEMKDMVDDLQELAEEQEELSEETEQTDPSDESKQEELQDKQEQINEKFDELQEKMENIEKKNDELEKPRDLGDEQQNEEQMENIEQELNDSQQQLQQQQNDKASESQQKASDKMKDMANQMNMQMQSGEMQQMQEDMQALRQLLENLVGLSFDQEDLMTLFDDVNVNTPRYVDLVQQQFKLEDDFKLVEDSLQALSKRVFQIESFVTEKVTEVKSHFRSGLTDLEDRKKNQASAHQQLAMKNINDLALMLSEVLNQMQQQMSSMMAGQQMCTQPKDGQGQKPGNAPKDKMSQGQQQLNQQMQKLKNGMQDGKGISSKEFAEMAARQAALRKALQEKQKQLQEQGKGTNPQLQELIDKMDQSEIDLVNKRLNNETLKRQKDILTRLLEHEKAEREREFEEKRKSETAKQFERKVPPSLEEYIKKRESEIESYRTVSPALKPYYKFLVEEYFKTLKKQK